MYNIKNQRYSNPIWIRFWGVFITIAFCFTIIPTSFVNNSILAFAVSCPTELSDNGLAFIKQQEEFSSSKYWDNSQYSIGYGSKWNENEYPSGTITEAEALELLKRQLNSTHVPAVINFSNNYGVSFTQNQFDALISFTYNLGVKWTTSNYSGFETIHTYLVDGRTSEEDIRYAFGLYVKSGGVTSTGLVNRRNAEATLFLTGSSDVDTSCNCSEDYVGDYIVSTESTDLIMRSGHGTGYSIVTTIPKGTTVHVSKGNGSWAHVDWNGYSGYCSMSYITKVSTSIDCNCSTDYMGDYIVSTESTDLIMRSGHGTEYSVITTIPKDTVVYVSKSNGSWAHVDWNGYFGYCSMNYLTRQATPSTPELSVITDNSLSNTTFSWNACDNTDKYSIRIWNGTVWQSEEPYSMSDLTNTSYEVNLPAGYYEVYVDAINNNGNVTMSNLISFTIQDVSINNELINFEDFNSTYQLELNNVIDTNNISWSSEDTSIATVDSTGLVTSIGNGITNIYATYNNQTFSCNITVANNVEVIPQISINDVEITSIGSTYQLELLNIDNIENITWISSDTTIVTVDNTGLVTALKNGTCTIYAIYNNQTFTCTVKVSVEYTVLLGDVNQDGNIKSNDLLMLKKYLLGLIDTSAININNADINQDGNVKSNDLLMLKKFLLGLINISNNDTTQDVVSSKYLVISNLNFRENAGISYTSYGIVPKNTLVTVTETTIDTDGIAWGKYEYNGNIGWSSLNYLHKLEPCGKTSNDYDIYTVDGLTFIDNILIVNKTYSLTSSYAPLNDTITTETQSAFDIMESDALKLGLNIYISSGYRSYDYQSNLYQKYVNQDGQALADTYSARAGHSEHQTGLCFDLNTITSSFANTKEGIWVAENCYKYGFIIRYPEGKSDITGYKYEPWHLRYVGVDLATKVYQSGLCLEEYFGINSVYET